MTWRLLARIPWGVRALTAIALIVVALALVAAAVGPRLP